MPGGGLEKNSTRYFIIVESRVKYQLNGLAQSDKYVHVGSLTENMEKIVCFQKVSQVFMNVFFFFSSGFGRIGQSG